MTARCPDCFARVDATHRALGRCPGAQPTPTTRRQPPSLRGYVPPSRSSRVPRDEYLASVRVDPAEKRRKATERMRAHRARKRAA